MHTRVDQAVSLPENTPLNIPCECVCRAPETDLTPAAATVDSEGTYLVDHYEKNGQPAPAE